MRRHGGWVGDGEAGHVQDDVGAGLAKKGFYDCRAFRVLEAGAEQGERVEALLLAGGDNLVHGGEIASLDKGAVEDDGGGWRAALPVGGDARKVRGLGVRPVDAGAKKLARRRGVVGAVEYVHCRHEEAAGVLRAASVKIGGKAGALARCQVGEAVELGVASCVARDEGEFHRACCRELCQSLCAVGPVGAAAKKPCYDKAGAGDGVLYIAVDRERVAKAEGAGDAELGAVRGGCGGWGVLWGGLGVFRGGGGGFGGSVASGLGVGAALRVGVPALCVPAVRWAIGVGIRTGLGSGAARALGVGIRAGLCVGTARAFSVGAGAFGVEAGHGVREHGDLGVGGGEYDDIAWRLAEIDRLARVLERAAMFYLK